MAYFNADPDYWDTINSPVAGLKVSNIFPHDKPKDVYTVSPTTNIRDLMKLLHSHRILSAPVVNEEGKILGIIDLLDVCLALVGKFQTPEEFKSGENSEDFLLTPVDEIMAVSLAYKQEMNPCLEVNAHIDVDGHLPDLLNLMWGGWHRVPVTRNGKIISFVSQSDILQFMVHHMGLVLGPGSLKKTVEQLGFLSPVKTVTGTTSVHAALCIISSNQLSALPVVGAEGEVLSNFSSSDLRCLQADSLSDLSGSVLDFLEQHSYKNRKYTFPANISGMVGYTTAHNIKPSDTFELVMYKMAALRVHRLWVVDAANTPIGVIALGDLMRIFLFGR